MFLHRAMILQADSHDVSLVKNIIVALYVRRFAYRDLLPTDKETSCSSQAYCAVELWIPGRTYELPWIILLDKNIQYICFFLCENELLNLTQVLLQKCNLL